MDKIPTVTAVLDNLNGNPHCAHGPTVLFKRKFGTTERSFYACSACRDRKDCNFFHWSDENITPSKIKAWKLESERSRPAINHEALYRTFEALQQCSEKERAFCHSCNKLLLAIEAEKDHLTHECIIGITDYQMKHPSEFMKPLENAKKEAQYLFSLKTTGTIVDILRELQAKNVLCIGAPRIHEYISSHTALVMDSLLLDLDDRFCQFFSPKQFRLFNMFNNYFFDEEGTDVLKQFLKEGDGRTILVMDPPFGGRVEPLANTVEQLTKLQRELCPLVSEDMTVMWIFPYFMEPIIRSNCPSFTMLDYKVDYDNHPLFANGPKGRKHGSPVRIFTNARPKDIALPEDEGYRFCDLCQRWVSEENVHCINCNRCTSKDGRTYVHCDLCQRCVKPSWSHCDECKRCCLTDHTCGEFEPSQLCFNCHQTGHKKRDCPLHSTAIPLITIGEEEGHPKASSKKRKLSRNKHNRNSKKKVKK